MALPFGYAIRKGIFFWKKGAIWYKRKPSGYCNWKFDWFFLFQANGSSIKKLAWKLGNNISLVVVYAWLPTKKRKRHEQIWYVLIGNQKELQLPVRDKSTVNAVSTVSRPACRRNLTFCLRSISNIRCPGLNINRFNPKNAWNSHPPGR